MTLSTQTNKVVYTGNGVATVWPYSFLIPDGSDLTVQLVLRSSGNVVTVPPVQYSVTGLGSELGGTVTYPLSGSPISSLYSLVIKRAVAYTQETELGNQSAAYPADIEEALDYLTMQTQQLKEGQDRSILFSDADSVVTTLPVASARAGLLLGFDASGNPIAIAGINPSVTVSAAMVPVVTAPTTADALTALGIPGTLLDLLIPSGVEWPYHAGESVIPGFVFPVGQPCTPAYPNYRAKLVAASNPYGTNGVDPLMPDRRSTVLAVKSNMGGANNGLLTGGTVLGAVLGNQQTVLVTANLPPYIPVGTVTNGAITVNLNNASLVMHGGGAVSVGSGGSFFAPLISDLTVSSVTQVASTFLGAAQGGISQPLSVVQPTFVCNCILKVH